MTDDVFGVAVSDIQGDDIEQSGRDILGTSKYLSGDNAITQVWGEGNFIVVTFTPSENAVKTEVGIKNLEELDPSDNSALIKVEDQFGYKLRVVQTDAQGRKMTSYFNLDKLVLEEKA